MVSIFPDTIASTVLSTATTNQISIKMEAVSWVNWQSNLDTAKIVAVAPAYSTDPYLNHWVGGPGPKSASA
jgi:hypothetical protein